MIVINKYILFSDGQCRLVYKRGRLLFYKEGILVNKVSLPLSFYKRIATWFSLTARLLRLLPKVACRIDGTRFLVSYDGFAYCYDVEKGKLIREHHYCERMNNPCFFTKIEGISGFKNSIVYGEYPINPDRKPISIFQRDTNGNWNSVCTFNGNILHIHNIIPDKNRNCVYILTGDEDNESGIWEARDNFASIKPIVIGSQQYRSCVAFPVVGGLVYATDSPLESNAIYYLDIKQQKIFKKADLTGACIYGTEKNGTMYFTADVEPDARLPLFKYWTTYKLGPGIRDRKVRVVAGNLSDGFSTIAEFKKDIWPMTLFQFGNISFPNTENDDVLGLPQAISKISGKTIVLN